MTTERLSFAVDEELLSDLKTFIPNQLRSEVFRSLLRLLLKTQSNSNVYVIEDLINDRLEMVKKELVNAETA